MSLQVTLRLTAHIHFSQYTTLGSLCLCCGICSIPCPRMVPDTTGGIPTHGRHFNDAYGRVCNFFIPFALSQLNQVRRTDTRFLPDVGRRHVRPSNSHIPRGKNLIPRHSQLNVCHPRADSVVHNNGRAPTPVLHFSPMNLLSTDAHGNERESDLYLFLPRTHTMRPFMVPVSLRGG